MRVAYWLRDQLCPMLEPAAPTGPTTADSPTLTVLQQDEGVLREALSRLREELGAENDRGKSIDSKLLALGTVAPVSITILLAITTFLGGGRVHDYTRASILTLCLFAFYVSLQFACVLWAAVRGLSRRSYLAAVVARILPQGNESASKYLQAACEDIARRIEQHREVTNDKVSCLAIAHQALKNAVRGMICLILILGFVTLWEVLR